MAKKCYAEGLLTGISGNLSVFDEETGTMLITPTSLPYDEMLAEDIVNINLDGLHVENGSQAGGKQMRKPSSEWPMHAEIYKHYPNIKAQIHTHSPYATSFALRVMKNNENTAIPFILIEMKPILGGDIKVAEFAPPGTAEVGQKAIKALKDRHACLLASHGVLAAGETLEQAHTRAACLEEVAKIYSIALSNGLPIKEITQ
jgi:ribulose-5-phosphate 4-epimerase/fuculose-1-phosphate aldolase